MADYVDCYPKRPSFRAWVADAKRKLGATNNAEVAEQVMKIQPTTLNKWLGKSPTHKPNPDALKLLGDYLGRDYRALLDDPETAPPWRVPRALGCPWRAQARPGGGHRGRSLRDPRGG